MRPINYDQINANISLLKTIYLGSCLSESGQRRLRPACAVAQAGRGRR